MIIRIFNILKKKEIELYLKHSVQESVLFGVLLAIVGGFLDAYTFIGRGGVFANAQTGNIVLIGVYASQGKWGKALVPIPSILAFVIGVVVAELIKNNSSRIFTIDWKREILILEIIVLFIVGLIPENIPNIVVTVTISFVASVQVSSFRKLVDSPYSTTMCTGNLRSAAHLAYIAVTKKDYKSAIQAIRFLAIILSFLLGGFLGGLLTLIIGAKAIWISAIILIFTVVMFRICEGIN